ncbi:MAG TPA: hypothetical protein DCP91_08570 [Eggerthellaceae bacterium]|nr:hypothetical protein [Eggerthellaceae bacterium]
MLGRHNVTIYADEAERCIGLVSILGKKQEWTETERAYWAGVTNTMLLLMSTSLPDDAQAFVAALKLHFTGEQPGELVEENQTDKE